MKHIRGGKVRPESIQIGLRPFVIKSGIPTLEDLYEEVDEMRDILLGRKESPIEGSLALMEVADAYFARASEITMLLLRAEQEDDDNVMREAGYTKFRTGELRTFMEMAKRAADLGSRRLTQEQMLLEQERLGRESG